MPTGVRLVCFRRNMEAQKHSGKSTVEKHTAEKHTVEKHTVEKHTVEKHTVEKAQRTTKE
jgi:hypothetical protein